MKKLLLFVVLWALVVSNATSSIAETAASEIVIGQSHESRLSLGFGHGCALDLQGRVACWGWNGEGATGRGFYSEKQEPLAFLDVPTSKKIVSGFGGSCALTVSKEVWCWGNYFDLRNGGDKALRPMKVEGLAGITDVAVTSSQVCVVDSIGAVLCWGGNKIRFGDHILFGEETPTKIQGFENIVSIYGGQHSLCGMDSKQALICYGALLRSSQNSLWEFLVPAVEITDMTGLKQISMGFHHICGIRESQKVVCYGNNDAGQLGVNSKVVVRDVVEPLGLPPVIGVSAKFYETCAWSVTGENWCWGSGNNTISHIPVRVSSEPGLSWFTDNGLWRCQLSLSGQFECQPRFQGTSVDFSAFNALTFRADNSRSKRLVLEWFENLHLGQVSSYQVSYSPTGTNEWKDVPDGKVARKTVTIENLETAVSYQIRVTPIVSGAPQRPSIFLAPSSGLGSLPLKLTDDLGRPLSGGSYSWATLDGRARSAKSLEATDFGLVTFTSVPGKALEVSLVDARTQDGLVVRGSFTVHPIGRLLTLRLPARTPTDTVTAHVKMPNGFPVSGAKVQVRGLSTTQTLSDMNFRGQVQTMSNAQQVTNESGNVTFSGWREGDPEIKATYDDGEIFQSSDWQRFSTNDPEVFLDYMPVLEASASTSLASANTLVSISVSVSETFQTTNFRKMSKAAVFETASSADFSGFPVEVVAPRDSNQTKCKGKTSLKAKLNSKGHAKLVVCANASGIYNMKAKGAISLGGVFIRVKNTKPTEPQALSVMVSANTASLSWQEPRFAGGIKVASYKIIATANGQVPRVVSVPHSASTSSVVIRNLDGNQAWSFSVFAVNKFGTSPSASIVQIVEGKVYLSMSKLGKPTVKGIAKKGSVVKGMPGSWDTGVTLKYQWLRNGVAIPGATKSKYLVTTADSKSTLKLRVEASKIGYRTTQSESVGVKVK